MVLKVVKGRVTRWTGEVGHGFTPPSWVWVLHLDVLGNSIAREEEYLDSSFGPEYCAESVGVHTASDHVKNSQAYTPPPISLNPLPYDWSSVTYSAE